MTDVSEDLEKRIAIPSSISVEPYNQWLEDWRLYASHSPHDRLHSGDHLGALLRYVSRTDHYRSTHNEPQSIHNEPQCRPVGDYDPHFAVLYDFNEAQPEIPLKDPVELEAVEHRNETAQRQSQLLFLQGHPSPEWIRAVGRTFGVDPQVLYHHLWRFQQQRDTACTWPPLASSAVQESRFCLSTLGCLNDPGRHERRDQNVQKLRKNAKAQIVDYLQKVRQSRQHVELGDSLLRQLSVHDGTNFSYEQYITVWTRQTQKGWFALVMLDVGNTLVTGMPEDRNKWLMPLGGYVGNTVFLPTVVGNYSRDAIPKHDPGPVEAPARFIPQNARHLCRGYHTGLDLELARRSSFYALQPLWALITASEKQFLNMMRDVVKRDIRKGRDAGDDQDDAALSNLLYNQDILEQHADRLRQNVRSIDKWEAWPNTQDLRTDHLASIRKIGTSLREDFGDLLHKAEHHENKCNQGANRIMKLVSHAETKKQLVQAQRVEQLTKLTFLFAPSFFVAALFGMNFKQLGQGELSIWLYFAITIPLIALALVVMESVPRNAILGCIGQVKRRIHHREEAQRHLYP